MADICDVHGPYHSGDGGCPYCVADRAPAVPPTVLSGEPRILGLLVRVSGDDPGEAHRVGDELLVGRDGAAAGLCLDDDQVSGQHARLSIRSGQVYVEDLGSSNGSFINEQRIDGLRVLREDDRLRLGNTSFVLKSVQL